MKRILFFLLVPAVLLLVDGCGSPEPAGTQGKVHPPETCSISDAKTAEVLVRGGRTSFDYTHNATALTLALMVRGNTVPLSCLHQVEEALENDIASPGSVK